MTIEQKARILEREVERIEGHTRLELPHRLWDKDLSEASLLSARLGIIEGLEMAERKLSECWTTAHARDIIRALIEEQKV